ncbi:modular polyketide synthase [Alloactinosynnema sp. L-07]|uniref:acyltransferase domain-containing protein n=1 Tax=Alloactinosynnema sp. L-07 TaxID=1653480 RepID=UPI00065F099A|nr:acyltransferase domain-containing protein [Alloactinosynnema sp. L-07]CRK57238.1 modular polyketide synthase [Alloactinosynnema sp. L-07]
MTDLDLRPVVVEPERLLILAASSPAELGVLLDRPDRDVLALHPGTADGARLGIVDPTPRRLALARKVVGRGRALRGRDDVWFSPNPLLRTGATAFVFPGLEADFAPRVDDVAELLGQPVPDLATHTVGRHGMAVLAVGRLLDAALRRLRITPAALAGHSVGEWTAMIAGGVVTGADFDAMLARTDLDALRVPGVEFAVLGTTADRVAAAIADQPDLVVSHENSTNQTVVCGPGEQIEALVARMRQASVICQVLPFRSGFHTPMLAPYLGEFEQGVPSLRMRAASIPVWSATTARPFPADPAAVRALSVRHLIEPVRFRATIEAMYASGIRVFVQAGPGQLGSLIADTLREADHLTVVANTAQRPGVDQLRRVATALWVEGGDPDFTALTPAPAVSRLAEWGDRFPAVLELTALIEDTTAAVEAVLAAAVQPRPRALDQTLRVSTADMPHLVDHCFAWQRDGWPDEDDRRPVVPATTVVQHLIDAAQAAAPGRLVLGVDDVRLRRWLDAAPAVEVPVRVRTLDADRLAVELGDYASGTVVVGARYPQAPAPWPVQPGERPPALSARDLYAQRWMFHGPSYQGLTRTVAVSNRAIRAEITVPSAPGALLDNVGQVLGHWLVDNHPDRWIAFPIAIDQIRFHAAPPAIRSTVDCAVRVTDLDDAMVRADAQVRSGGVVVVSISGWADTRFDSDAAIGAVHRFPETSMLSERTAGGWWTAAERWPGLASREFYLRKYLGSAERAEYEACPPTTRRRWLLRRVVAKDAVRGHLWDSGYGPLFPAEVRVHDDDSARCAVSGVAGLVIPDLEVSVDSSHELGVAVVGGRIAVAALDDADVVAARARLARFWHTPDHQSAAAAATGGGGLDLTVSQPGVRTELIANPAGLPARHYVVAWTAPHKEETS